MAFILNDPADFTDELTAGFSQAYSSWVTQVPGGVVRATAVPEGEVAIITGGGSGHYPAFAGLVGPGLAHGAAMGNIFASPSAQQIYSVAKAAHAGGGILFTYGNYAGDVLNFNQAQERLQAEGIDCRTVVVTDDIASAGSDEIHKRRGIAGDLFVFKVAAAAAEAGKNLAEVVEAASAANAMTRSLGVAFTGCTLPGAPEPLFTVPEGRMGIGMGIHGEPGIDEQDILPAEDLAELLVERLLAEKPKNVSERAVVLLNGLGSISYEELFVLYNSIAPRLSDAGVTVVAPDVGELVTSFEMAGVSLTISWLTPKLEEYWLAPVNTPAYRKGNRKLDKARKHAASEQADEKLIKAASADSQRAAVQAAGLFAVVEKVINNNAEHLGELDAIAGDGDHGIGMQRGSRAAAKASKSHAEKKAGLGSVLIAAGDAWADKAGGTSGALWGILLCTIGQELDDTTEISAQSLSNGISNAVAKVQSFGDAQVGDKTMVDALVPFSTTFASQIGAQESVVEAFALAAKAADDAAKSTADLTPKLGRARAHTEKSVGTPDPGAVSFALIAQSLVNKLKDR